MGRVTLTLPRLGETMEEARVTEWIVSPGGTYARGDVLLEVETDKTVVEVPALADGTLITQLVNPGDTVDLGAPIAEVDQDGDARPVETSHVPLAGDPRIAATRPAPKRTSSPTRPADDKVAASPAARAAARRHGVSLSGITGSGRRGRITADDVAQSDGTVVLLHGVFDSTAGWRGIPERLKKKGLRCVALDLPGHGNDTTEVESFNAAVDHLAEQLPKGPVHLVGHSLGGALAARLSTFASVNALSLTLFAPVGLGPSISADFLDDMSHATTLEAFKNALAYLDAGPMSDVAVSQQLQQHNSHLTSQVALARIVATGGIQQCDITADIAAAPCPVSVVFGTNDRILDWRDVANLPAETRIHLIPNAGHLPHLVRPDLAVALIAFRHDSAEFT